MEVIIAFPYQIPERSESRSSIVTNDETIQTKKKKKKSQNQKRVTDLEILAQMRATVDGNDEAEAGGDFCKLRHAGSSRRPIWFCSTEMRIKKERRRDRE